MPSDTGPVVCSFESRRAEEMRSLIERFGGVPVLAPSMREIPVEQNAAAIDAIQRIVAGEAAYLILLTGVGTEAMLQVAASCFLKERLLQTMSQLPLLIRGPKPAAVLSRLGLSYAVKAPEPNTWTQLLSAIDEAGIELRGTLVAVQEYGVPNPELYAGLQQRGAKVLPVPVYRWALPEDLSPLQSAIDGTIAGTTDILMFTSAQQVRHVLMVAERGGQQDQWRAAAGRTLVASIGPTCTEALVESGLDVGFEARPPKMGPLVRGAIEQWKNPKPDPGASHGEIR